VKISVFADCVVVKAVQANPSGEAMSLLAGKSEECPGKSYYLRCDRHAITAAWKDIPCVPKQEADLIDQRILARYQGDNFAYQDQSRF
jgi:hypothetical protein